MSDVLTTAPPAELNASPGRTEIILVVLISLVGFALRMAHPARLAVEHFDEGVYASNLFFQDRAGAGHYPEQHLYAPPLLPLLIEFAMIVFGPSNGAAMAVNIAAGTLTVPILWWLGRRWFGGTAGLAAGTLAALNDAHIFFSRTALTDVLVCLLLICALHYLHNSLAARSRLALFATIGAGAMTSLAWWTKYTGWLPLAIALAGLIPWKLLGDMKASVAGELPRLSMRSRTIQLLWCLLRWSLAALIAFAFWSGWLMSLEKKGGYSAVAANHRGYVTGLAEWTAQFKEQVRKLTLLDGIPTGCSLLAACAVSIVVLRREDRRFTWNVLLSNDVVFFVLPVAVLLCVMDGANVVLAFLGGIGVFVGLFRLFKIPGAAPASELPQSPAEALPGTLAAWMLAAWFMGLSLTIPLYTPYPRLLLPLLIASWLGMGILVDKLIRLIRSQASQRLAAGQHARPLLAGKQPAALAISRFRPVVILAFIVAIFLAVQQGTVLGRGVPGWEPRTGLAMIAPGMLDDACRNAGLDRKTQSDKLAIYVYGEPPLVFNLRLAGADYVNPVKDVSFANPEAPAPQLPSFVVIGPHAWATAGFGEQMAKALPRLELIGTYIYYPSQLVVLDTSVRHTRRPQSLIELYRVK